jgi:hypothetical protein
MKYLDNPMTIEINTEILLFSKIEEQNATKVVQKHDEGSSRFLFLRAPLPQICLCHNYWS